MTNTVGPTSPEYLGIIPDSEKKGTRLPQEKIKRICNS